MILRKPLNFIGQFLSNIFEQIRKIYLNSNYYNNKISKISKNSLIYRPSPHLLSSLIKYQAKKINVNNIATENLWDNEKIDIKNFRKLNNFYWFFSLDLKSLRKVHKKSYLIG